MLGVATVDGELPNSFLKRRLDIPPGAQRHLALTILDQADFVLLAWPLLTPLYRLSAREAADCFAVVALVHLPINLIGRWLGVRRSAL